MAGDQRQEGSTSRGRGVQRGRRQARSTERGSRSLTQAVHRLRLVGSGGANKAMEAEVKRLGPRTVTDFAFPKPKRLDEQTLAYPFDPSLARLAVHYLRTPSRAYWDLFVVDETRLEPLYQSLLGLLEKDERAFLPKRGTLSVSVGRADKFEAGPLQIRGTVKNAVIEAARRRGCSLRVEGNAPDLSFAVRETPEGLLIALDLAGQSLHRRGWRLDGAEASLKETLAAQMLILARWNPRTETLVDPMAGAGTIALEAAFSAVGRRRWVEPHRPRFPESLGDVEPLPDLFPGTEPSIVANEIDRGVFFKLQSNLQRAGANVQVKNGDLGDLRVDGEAGLILTNPPYGKRIMVDDGVYEALRDFAKRSGFRMAVLSGNPRLEEIVGPPRVKKPMNNGPLKAHFLLWD